MLPVLLLVSAIVGPAIGVQNPSPLGETLLSQLRDGHPTENTISLKCRDSKEVTAHRNVLMATSPYFGELFETDLRQKDAMVVQYPSDVVDLVLDFVYTNKRIDFDGNLIIDLFAAAKTFRLQGLIQQLEELSRKSLSRWMRSERFLEYHPADNVLQFKEIFAHAMLSPVDKNFLVMRVHHWALKMSVDFPTAFDVVGAVNRAHDDRTPRTEALVLLTNNSLLEIVNGHLYPRTSLNETLASKIRASQYSVIKKETLYLASQGKSGIELYNFDSGAHLSTIAVPQQLLKLKADHNEIYVTLFNSNGASTLYDIRLEHLNRLALLKGDVYFFGIVERNDNKLRCVYSDYNMNNGLMYAFQSNWNRRENERGANFRKSTDLH